jgi:subtilisin family serine protease
MMTKSRPWPILFFGVVFGSFILFNYFSRAVRAEDEFNSAFAANEVLVKFKAGSQEDVVQRIIGNIQGTLITYLRNEIGPQERISGRLSHLSFLGDADLFLVRVPDTIGTRTAISILLTCPEIEYAEKNIILHPLEISDPLFSAQWALQNTYTPGEDISAIEAWGITTGSSDIIVSILDNGIDSAHPDLSANIWQNPGETADNSNDDDFNGYEDDKYGWHWDVPESIREEPTSAPFYYAYDPHGTHIAGIIGAAWNDLGVRGINQNVRIMNLNLLGDSHAILLSSLIQAIDYSIDNGASIISCSLGWAPGDAGLSDYSQALEDAIIRARNRGVLIVTACGNHTNERQWWDVDEDPSHHIYPGCYPEDNIINVLATARDGALGAWTMYGATSVDLGAPGDWIKSTGMYLYQQDPSLWYITLSGSSMAAPQVAGVAALALARCPALPYAVLKSRILSGGDTLQVLAGRCVTGKRLNAYNTIYDPTNPPSPNAPSDLSGAATAWNRVEIGWMDNSNNELGFEIQRYTSVKQVFLRYMSSNQNEHVFVDNYARTHVGSVTYKYRVRSGNLGGMSAFSNTIEIQIPYTVPAAPSSLAAETSIIPNIVLTWADNANNESTFIIERKKAGGSWSQVGVVGANLVTYTDHVTLAGTYYYRMKAQNPVGSSPYSSQLTVVAENP